LLSVAIGIGLVVSLLFAELFGLVAGGMVVPGYIALYLNRPAHVAMTLGTAVAAYVVVRILATVTIIYGRRRTAAMILVGYLFGAAASVLKTTIPAMEEGGVEVIGFIIPGLIAIWIDRQGLVETVATLLTAGVVVRLILLIIFGAEMLA
jgi:poly-gamma-glutamate biosynthesis protein PgsC/CapC